MLCCVGQLSVCASKRISFSKRSDTLGGRGTDDEIDESYEQVHFDKAAIELRKFRSGAQKIRQRKHVDERRVLKEDDRLAQNDWARDAQHLWQDNMTIGVVGGQCECLTRFELTFVHGAQSNAHDLRVVGGLKQTERNEGRVGGSDRNRAAGAAQISEYNWHQEEKPEEDEDERD